MKTQRRVLAVAAVLGFAGAAQAHHSISMFDISKSIWLEGTIVRYAPIAPHAMIELELTGRDGEVERWVVEGPSPGRLNRVLAANGSIAAEDFLKPGSTVEVCGFALKERWDPERMYANSGWSSKRFVHGQMIVMPDGHMQSWGPYGKLENCVGPDDQVETWRDFLNADALARGQWCVGLNDYSKQFATLPTRAFVDEVMRQIGDPCN